MKSNHMIVAAIKCRIAELNQIPNMLNQILVRELTQVLAWIIKDGKGKKRRY